MKYETLILIDVFLQNWSVIDTNLKNRTLNPVPKYWTNPFIYIFLILQA